MVLLLIHRRIINYFQIDEDLLWTLMTKIWSLVKGPISILFIMLFLSPEEQGLWYTFISLGALSIFAELGFTTIITQFVSHECASVKLLNGNLIGDKNQIDRIVSLIRYSLRFYLFVIPFSVFILVIVGYYFFEERFSITYLAWIVFSFVGGLNLFSSLFQAIYQGLDKVKTIQRNILIGSIAMTIFNWILLYLGLSIWSLVLGNLLGVLLMLFLLFRVEPNFWLQILRHKLEIKVSWWNEIIRLQWRYAVSWVSGYFIFFFLVPSVYKFEDSVLAGQLGATISIVNAITGITYSWMNSKLPKFNIMASRKQREELIQLFSKLFKIAIFVYILLGVFFLFFLKNLEIFNFHRERFLGYYLTILVLISQFPNVINGLNSYYLRSHKIEPFFFLSVLTALFNILFIIFLLPEFGLKFFYFSLLFVQYVILLPYGIFIFFRYRDEILPINFYK